MNAAVQELNLVAGTSDHSRRWWNNGDQPRNATASPSSDEYKVIAQYLYAWVQPSVVTPKPHKAVLGRKSGAEPGWLPDDDLTRRWLQYVEEYRAECDAADREEPPKNEEAKEVAS